MAVFGLPESRSTVTGRMGLMSGWGLRAAARRAQRRHSRGTARHDLGRGIGGASVTIPGRARGRLRLDASGVSEEAANVTRSVFMAVSAAAGILWGVVGLVGGGAAPDLLWDQPNRPFCVRRRHCHARA